MSTWLRNSSSGYLFKRRKAYVSKKTCMWIVKASSFVASRIWKESKRSLIGKYINKLEYIHNMKYYSKIKSDAAFIYVKTWLNFTNMMLCERKWKWKLLSHVRLLRPMDYTVHGILQARILEWVAFSFSRGASQPRDWIQVSHIAGGFFTSWATVKHKRSHAK